MVRGQFKSRTYRRVFVKTPGNRLVMHVEKRRPRKPLCAACKRQLQGVMHARAKVLHGVAKTDKRPQRPFGGQLCSPCAERRIIQNARKGGLVGDQ